MHKKEEQETQEEPASRLGRMSYPRKAPVRCGELGRGSDIPACVTARPLFVIEVPSKTKSGRPLSRSRSGRVRRRGVNPSCGSMSR